MLKSFQIHTYENGTLGLHLTRAPWDPYPWISSIQTDSSAYATGLRIGDTVLEFNGCDILGLKISEIALLLKSHWLQDTRVNSNTNDNSNDNNSEADNDDNCHYVTMVIWRNETQASVVHETHNNKDCNAKDEDAENNALNSLTKNSSSLIKRTARHVERDEHKNVDMFAASKRKLQKAISGYYPDDCCFKWASLATITERKAAEFQIFGQIPDKPGSSRQSLLF
uniref:PDZ domain-containing protein n=1 Tax=Glossina austeni TaxID=7395 RepID=A0A1A9UZW0_GLOAU